MGLGECINRVTAASNWASTFRKLPFGRGIGIACSSYICGAGLPIYWNNMPHSGVQLRLDRSGGVTSFCGSTEIGQGSTIVLVHRRGEFSASIRSTFGWSPATPISRRSISDRIRAASR